MITKGPSEVDVEPNLPPELYRLTFCDFVMWVYKSCCRLTMSKIQLCSFWVAKFFKRSAVRRSTNASVILQADLSVLPPTFLPRYLHVYPFHAQWVPVDSLKVVRSCKIDGLQNPPWQKLFQFVLYRVPVNKTRRRVLIDLRALIVCFLTVLQTCASSHISSPTSPCE